tara:strand:+ start:498 stop:1061 length:564 start_codon:yes stop_codon:yes gene_type:complete
MRTLLFTALLFISSIFFAQVDTLGVEWQHDYHLKWSDFKGKEDKSQKLSALSKISIPYTYSSDGEVDLTLNLSTVFVKDESWYKKGKENNVLLGHEQLHFDIAEIHRRIIVKTVLSTKFSAENYESELKQLISKIWDEDYRKMQDQYDAETNYARLFRSQKEWMEIVATKLIELKEFNDTEVTVTFQ